MSYFQTIKGLTSDTTSQVPRIDTATHTLQTIEYEHHEIHLGSSFTCSYTADIGNGANMDIEIVTPDTTEWAHFLYELEVEAESHLTIYEASTLTEGTALVVHNRDRNSATANTTLVYHTPTGITTGTTKIREAHIGSGKTIGGGNRGTQEFILKRNTKYLIRITNATTSNNYMSIKLDWYEHTNKGLHALTQELTEQVITGDDLTTEHTPA
jgi:hypothetical protein